MTTDIYPELPSTRKQALECGSKLYFTGKPCLRHHIAPRYAISSKCKECVEMFEWRSQRLKKR